MEKINFTSIIRIFVDSIARGWEWRFDGNGSGSYTFVFVTFYLKNILRHFPCLKVFVKNPKLQLYQLIKIRVSNKKLFEQEYCGVYEDSKFTFVYFVTKLLQIFA